MSLGLIFRIEEKNLKTIIFKLFNCILSKVNKNLGNPFKSAVGSHLLHYGYGNENVLKTLISSFEQHIVFIGAYSLSIYRQGFPLHLLSGHSTYIGTFLKTHLSCTYIRGIFLNAPFFYFYDRKYFNVSKICVHTQLFRP